MAYLPFFGGAAALCDAVRLRKIDIPGTIKTAVVLTLPTVLILAALYASFGWFEDISAVGMQKENPKWANWAGFTYCMVPMFNLLPFLILAGVWFHWQAGKAKPLKLEVMVATGILAGWVLYYLTLIVATRAEFVHRLMLPMVPAVVVLAGFLMSRLEMRAPRLTASVAMAVCAVNVALVVYCMNLPTVPPLPLGHYVSIERAATSSSEGSPAVRFPGSSKTSFWTCSTSSRRIFGSGTMRTSPVLACS